MRYLVPVSLIVGLLVLLGIGLRLDPTEVPSPLIGKLAPPFDLPTLEDDGRVTSDVLLGQPTLVNFFASWCTPCLAEHPLFMRLSAGGRHQPLAGAARQSVCTRRTRCGGGVGHRLGGVRRAGKLSARCRRAHRPQACGADQ